MCSWGLFVLLWADCVLFTVWRLLTGWSRFPLRHCVIKDGALADFWPPFIFSVRRRTHSHKWLTHALSVIVIKGRICNLLDWITSELRSTGPFRQSCSPLQIGLASTLRFVFSVVWLRCYWHDRKQYLVFYCVLFVYTGDNWAQWVSVSRLGPEFIWPYKFKVGRGSCTSLKSCT